MLLCGTTAQQNTTRSRARWAGRTRSRRDRVPRCDVTRVTHPSQPETTTQHKSQTNQYQNVAVVLSSGAR